MDKISSNLTRRAGVMVGHIFKKRKRPKLVKTSSSREAVSRAIIRASVENLRQEDVRSGGTDQQQSRKLWERKGTKSHDNLQDSSTRMKRLETENDNLRLTVRELTNRLKVVNRQLEQERSFYDEERWGYVQEIKATIKQTSSTTTQTKDYVDSDDEDGDTLANELRRARVMFYKQRRMTCRLSEKFLRLRDHRDRLTYRLRRLEMVYTAVIDELLKHVAELRVNFASVENGQLLDKNGVGRLVDRNAKLSYNNAILHLEVLKFEKKLEAMKSRTVNYKDALEVDQFLEKCRSHRLLQMSRAGGGDGRFRSVPIMRVGRLINVPVAVHIGNRIETNMIPLFGIVRLSEAGEKGSSSSRNKGTPLLRRRIQSVPSKVWRVKNDVVAPAAKAKKRRKSTLRLDGRVDAKSCEDVVIGGNYSCNKSSFS